MWGDMAHGAAITDANWWTKPAFEEGVDERRTVKGFRIFLKFGLRFGTSAVKAVNLLPGIFGRKDDENRIVK